MNPIAYVTAKSIIEIPFMLLLALGTLGIGGFVMIDFNTLNFWFMVLIFLSVLLAFKAIAQETALTIKRMILAMLRYVIVWFTVFLFSEIWIGKDDEYLPFQLLFFVSPFRLVLQAFIYLDFTKTDFSCGDSLSMFTSAECVDTFSGEKVLKIVRNFVFPIVQSSVDVLWSVFVTLMIALAFKVIEFGL